MWNTATTMVWLLYEREIRGVGKEVEKKVFGHRPYIGGGGVAFIGIVH